MRLTNYRENNWMNEKFEVVVTGKEWAIIVESLTRGDPITADKAIAILRKMKESK